MSEGESDMGLNDTQSDDDALADSVSHTVECAPDTDIDYVDGMYVTYEKLGQLVRRANAVRTVHCPGCMCDSTSDDD